MGAGAAHEERGAFEAAVGLAQDDRLALSHLRREARTRILQGEQSIASLGDQNVGEIKAHIVERDGR